MLIPAIKMLIYNKKEYNNLIIKSLIKIIQINKFGESV